MIVDGEVRPRCLCRSQVLGTLEHVSKTRWDVAFCSCFAVKYATSPETDPLSYFWILCLIFTPFSSQRIARLLKLAGGRRARRSEFGRRGGHSPAPRRDLHVGGGGSGPWEGHPSPRTPGAPGTAPSPRRGAGSPAGVREREREGSEVVRRGGGQALAATSPGPPLSRSPEGGL